MIIRIVKMTFYPEKIEEFLSYFEVIKDQISSFDGCSNLELMKDDKEDNVYFTYSHWESLDHLDSYRSSDLFHDIWPNVTEMFSEKPQAHSLLSM